MLIAADFFRFIIATISHGCEESFTAARELLSLDCSEPEVVYSLVCGGGSPVFQVSLKLNAGEMQSPGKMI